MNENNLFAKLSNSFISFYLDVYIGFNSSLLEVIEPDETEKFNIFLVKENNVVSEQTFSLTLTFTTESGLRPATINGSSAVKYDYGIKFYESNTILFPSNVEWIPITFFVTSDDEPEGLEGFKVNFAANDVNYPRFQSSINRAFIVVHIIDNDCK